MGLFSRLLDLHSSPRPVEDFFTEVVAGLFTAAPDLCTAWLEHLGLMEPTHDDRERKVLVGTQRRIGPLPDHATGSRLDLVVEVSSDAGRDVVYLESKIDSGEGAEQLRRYADLLSEVEGARSRTLVYVTRDYDPKDEDEVLRVPEKAGDEGGPQGGETTHAPVRFVQLRWGDFYRFLRGAVDREHASGEAERVLDPGSKVLVGEVMSFMEERGMAQRNVFTAEDLAAMSRLQHTMALMEETLKGRVAEALSDFTGAKVEGQAVTLKDFFSWGTNRYVLHSLLVRNHQWWCAAGFVMHADDFGGGYPSVVVFLEVAPNAERRREILAALRRWVAERDRWEGGELEQEEGEWSEVYRKRGLQEFLSGEDHVSAIRTFLVESLEELSEMKHEFPDLPWPGR